ncbi:nitrite reductase/ring-hydroxylating ferredoxin subunit [Spinactinospora alkalitolerans]|uniref:Cytochrome bc1 complex Rieske iron-sulfur subunit n=1 Tax=Spinactinospora alkalitolerans TaxID=687207 RepID=A0A852TTH9_9ACTN|nr:Rieske (2Fe-2S) protein [Spinactinospora alkalitolerans]NYE46607.1 nitrite reductase/ring-hydroxylating ferredoxin subunit [Spinactinospora alkalitolerans]
MSRRRLLGAAGAAGAAALGAGACAGPGDDPQPQDKLHGTVIARTDDVPVGGGTVVIDAKLVVTQPQKGEFKAFSAVCTHAGCTVQEVEDNIHCLCHGSEFDIGTGDAVGGPAGEPLEPFEVRIEGADIILV